jgi:hypothetical protein
MALTQMGFLEMRLGFWSENRVGGLVIFVCIFDEIY